MISSVSAAAAPSTAVPNGPYAAPVVPPGYKDVFAYDMDCQSAAVVHPAKLMPPPAPPAPKHREFVADPDAGGTGGSAYGTEAALGLATVLLISAAGVGSFIWHRDRQITKDRRAMMAQQAGAGHAVAQAKPQEAQAEVDQPVHLNLSRPASMNDVRIPLPLSPSPIPQIKAPTAPPMPPRSKTREDGQLPDDMPTSSYELNDAGDFIRALSPPPVSLLELPTPLSSRSLSSNTIASAVSGDAQNSEHNSHKVVSSAGRGSIIGPKFLRLNLERAQSLSSDGSESSWEELDFPESPTSVLTHAVLLNRNSIFKSTHHMKDPHASLKDIRVAAHSKL